jgi:hypothetical protein
MTIGTSVLVEDNWKYNTFREVYEIKMCTL